MAGKNATNHHFKQLTSGVPGAVMGQIGEALLAVDAQRRGEKVDAPIHLRNAWFALAQWLIRNRGSLLNPHQLAFLLSGALADSVTLKDQKGQLVAVDLLPAPIYESLLTEEVDDSVPFLLSPLRRFAALASDKLAPLDPDKPGRYKEPEQAVSTKIDPQLFKNRLAQHLRKLEETQPRLTAATHKFIEMMQADRLRLTISSSTDLNNLMSRVLQHKSAPDDIAQLDVPRDIEQHDAVLAVTELRQQITGVLDSLLVVEQDSLRALRNAHDAAVAVTKISAGGAARVSAETLFEMSPVATKRAESDVSITNAFMVQALQSSPQRTAWSASRILLAEHLEKLEDPQTECFATPENLARSIAKIDALHPNCFPHDRTGTPLLPPVIIEPGAGIVKWFDDRFIMSFLCVELPRKGGMLSLSPVDLAVLEIYGQFLARGDLYNYRGERVTGNFVADYAGEVESKAKVKFTGADKKMTFVSATELKDAAGREDAVKDYIDFVFHINNGLNLPKRITPRRISVLLKYCIFGNVQQTATLTLRYVPGYDPKAARQIISHLADKNDVRIIDFFKQALEDDAQLASRFRRDIKKALVEVMGHDFVASAERDGLFGGPAQSVDLSKPRSSRDADSGDSGHDYFDL